MCAGPAASAGVEPARLSARLQVKVQQEDPAPAQTGATGLRDSGAGIQQLPAGRRVEEGQQRTLNSNTHQLFTQELYFSTNLGYLYLILESFHFFSTTGSGSAYECNMMHRHTVY